MEPNVTTPTRSGTSDLITASNQSDIFTNKTDYRAKSQDAERTGLTLKMEALELSCVIDSGTKSKD